MFAAGITQQLERIRPMDDILRSAAAVDSVAADLRADLQLRQRREAMTAIVAWIAAHGPLQEGLSQQDAAAVVWTLTSPEVHQMLRDTWDWPPERPDCAAGQDGPTWADRPFIGANPGLVGEPGKGPAKRTRLPILSLPGAAGEQAGLASF
jgi:hypothetical protein